ncbi:hypothetical protein TGARI_301460 [Toxoplasma gondii ARI]|uniref:Uncharacterized protein n=1 Tax=Toxoplasma gondii ARI TaxID=1074872 RepID=A0A139XJK7_TOXGO|nr:hypothetical protein TGARI_301460 [Toxoplasma gondii ARI]
MTSRLPFFYPASCGRGRTPCFCLFFSPDSETPHFLLFSLFLLSRSLSLSLSLSLPLLPQCRAPLSAANASVCFQSMSDSLLLADLDWGAGRGRRKTSLLSKRRQAQPEEQEDAFLRHRRNTEAWAAECEKKRRQRRKAMLLDLGLDVEDAGRSPAATVASAQGRTSQRRDEERETEQQRELRINAGDSCGDADEGDDVVICLTEHAVTEKRRMRNSTAVSSLFSEAETFTCEDGDSEAEETLHASASAASPFSPPRDERVGKERGSHAGHCETDDVPTNGADRAVRTRQSNAKASAWSASFRRLSTSTAEDVSRIFSSEQHLEVSLASAVPTSSDRMRRAAEEGGRRGTRTARRRGNKPDRWRQTDAEGAAFSVAPQSSSRSPDAEVRPGAQGSGECGGKTEEKQGRKKLRDGGDGGKGSQRRYAEKRGRRRDLFKAQEEEDPFAEEGEEERQRRLQEEQRREREAREAAEQAQATIEAVNQIWATQMSELGMREKEEEQVQQHAERFLKRHRFLVSQSTPQGENMNGRSGCLDLLAEQHRNSEMYAERLRLKLAIFEAGRDAPASCLSSSPLEEQGPSSSSRHKSSLPSQALVGSDQKFGFLAETVGKLRGLAPCCRAAIRCEVDGDSCDPETRFGEKTTKERAHKGSCTSVAR